jgi:Flp pilus assembly protein TadG
MFVPAHIACCLGAKIVRMNRTLRRLLRGNRSGTRGSAAVEFGIITPVLVLMAVCSIDFGIGFYRYLQVESAAGAGARYAAIHGFDATTMANAITAATSNLAISASPAPTQFCGCPSSTGITVAACGSTCTGGLPVGTYVTASAQSTYNPIINYRLLPKSFTLGATATVRIQ